jgi:hypothetical protein
MKLLLALLLISLTGCAQYAAAVDRADLCHPQNEKRRAELKLNCSPGPTAYYVRPGYISNTYIVTPAR